MNTTVGHLGITCFAASVIWLVAAVVSISADETVVGKSTEPALKWEQAGRLHGFAFTPNGRALAAAAGDTLVFWDINTGERQTAVPQLKSGANITAFALTPGGKDVAVAGEDGLVRFWQMETGASTGELKASEKPLRALIYSHDGASFITGDEAGQVVVWDAATRRQKVAKQAHAWPVTRLAISRTGGMLISGAQGRHDGGRQLESEVVLWNWPSFEKRWAAGDAPVMWLALAFWPNDDTVALSGAFKKAGFFTAELQLLKATDGSVAKTLTHGEGVNAGGTGAATAVLRDGRLVSCGPGGALLWTAEGKPQHEFSDRSSWTTPGVCASPDQAWIATFTEQLSKGAERGKDQSYTTAIKLWKMPK